MHSSCRYRGADTLPQWLQFLSEVCVRTGQLYSSSGSVGSFVGGVVVSIFHSHSHSHLVP